MNSDERAALLRQVNRLDAENLALSLALAGAREALEAVRLLTNHADPCPDTSWWVKLATKLVAVQNCIQEPPSLSRAQKLLDVVEKAKAFVKAEPDDEAEVAYPALVDALASLEEKL